MIGKMICKKKLLYGNLIWGFPYVCNTMDIVPPPQYTINRSLLSLFFNKAQFTSIIV